MGSGITSGQLGDLMVKTLVWNARDVGSIRGSIFPIFITLPDQTGRSNELSVREIGGFELMGLKPG